MYLPILMQRKSWIVVPGAGCSFRRTGRSASMHFPEVSAVKSFRTDSRIFRRSASIGFSIASPRDGIQSGSRRRSRSNLKTVPLAASRSRRATIERSADRGTAGAFAYRQISARIGRLRRRTGRATRRSGRERVRTLFSEHLAEQQSRRSHPRLRRVAQRFGQGAGRVLRISEFGL